MFVLAFSSTSMLEWFAARTPGDWVDMGFAAVLLFCAIRGTALGLSGEVGVWLGWLCGGVAGWFGYDPAWTALQRLDWFRQRPDWLTAAAALVAILLVWGVASVFRLALARLMKAVAKTPGNRFLGLIAGCIQAAALVLFICTALILLPYPRMRQVVCNESRVGQACLPYATPLASAIDRLLPKINVPRRDLQKDMQGEGRGASRPLQT